MTVLLLYSGHDGQTKSIMSVIAKEISTHTPCEMFDLNAFHNIKLNNYRAVLIGAAIRYGHFNKKLYQFADSHFQQLNMMPSAFFSVTLTARKPEKRTPETNLYTRKFLTKTKWKPQLCEVFAGALHYPRYTFFDKYMIKLIMKITGGETDTSKDIEYTDWQQVTRFAHHFTKNMLKQ